MPLSRHILRQMLKKGKVIRYMLHRCNDYVIIRNRLRWRKVRKKTGVKLYCNRYTHFKDPLVCSVSCQYRKRCPDFALYYDAHREEVNALVLDYYAKQGKPARQLSLYGTEAQATVLRELYTLEVKQIMTDTFIWIDAEDKATVLELDGLMERAETGEKPKHIFKIAQEMELRFQLVPRKRIEDTQRKAAADAERAAARKGKLAAAA